MNKIPRIFVYLGDPGIELPDLGQFACPGEVPGVNKHVAIRDRLLDVGGERVSVGHADEPQLMQFEFDKKIYCQSHYYLILGWRG